MTDVTAPLPGVETHPGSGHYAVYDHGAHVWSWQPEGQRPVLWLSSATALADGKAIPQGDEVLVTTLENPFQVIGHLTNLLGRAGDGAAVAGRP